MFREWQQQPYQVAPMSNESHQCATCGTHYEGNYCHLLTVIPIKQLSGYGYLSTLFRFLLAMLLFAVVFIVTLFVVSLIGSMVYTFLFR